MAAPLPRSVKILGLVSLLTDASSEMIYPLLPAFLTGALKAGPAFLGVVEGLAEALAAFVKIGAGALSASAALLSPGDLRVVFGLAAIPVVGARGPLVFVVREEARPPAEPPAPAASEGGGGSGPMRQPFRLYLLVLAVFTLGNSS